MTEYLTIVCAHCGRKCEKHAGAVRVTLARGQASYCSKLCAGRAYKAANRERLKVAENVRRWRPDVRAKIRHRSREYYYRNRDACLAYCKQYREANPAKVMAAIKRWRELHPDNVEVYQAKSILTQKLGLRWSQIPQDLAEAKAEQIKISRWVSEQLAASCDTHPKDGDVQQAPLVSGAVGDSRDAQTPSPTGGNS